MRRACQSNTRSLTSLRSGPALTPSTGRADDASHLRLLIRAASKRTSAEVANTLRRILGTTVHAEPLYAVKPGRRSTTERTNEFLARVRVTPAAAGNCVGFVVQPAGLVDAEAVLKCPLPKPAELAQICFDHPNAYVAFRRGQQLARSAVSASALERHDWLDLDGIAKYASTRLGERLQST